MTDYYICKLCESKVSKYDYAQMIGHILAIYHELKKYYIGMAYWEWTDSIFINWFIFPDESMGWKVKTATKNSVTFVEV